MHHRIEHRKRPGAKPGPSSLFVAWQVCVLGQAALPFRASGSPRGELGFGGPKADGSWEPALSRRI